MLVVTVHTKLSITVVDAKINKIKGNLVPRHDTGTCKQMKITKPTYYKIGLLWCQSHIELSLIEVKVKLSGMSLTSFGGQFDTFLMVVKSFVFCLFVAFWDHFEPLGALLG